MMAGFWLWRALALSAFWVGASASCAAQNAGDAAGPSEAFAQVLSACSGETGYRPEETEGLAPTELGRNERAWGECVYKGVEQHVTPQSAAPDLYRRLIARHRALTDAIGAKTATRADRVRELTPLLDDIRAAESAALTNREKEIRELQDAQEQQRMMAEVERVQRSAMRAEQSIRVRIR